jgi:hypothetical protein
MSQERESCGGEAAGAIAFAAVVLAATAVMLYERADWFYVAIVLGVAAFYAHEHFLASGDENGVTLAESLAAPDAPPSAP